MEQWPFITAMIVARNEEIYIEKCFKSLLEQSYPADRYEILIIDGMSTDSTVTVAKEVEKKMPLDMINGNQIAKYRSDTLIIQKKFLQRVGT